MNAKVSQGSQPSQLHALEDSDVVFTHMVQKESGLFLLRPGFQTVSQTLPLHAEGSTGQVLEGCTSVQFVPF